MKLKFLLSFLIIAVSLSLSAQKADLAYAITGSGNGDFLWMNIRQIDLSTGSFTKNIFEKGLTSFQMRNAVTGEEIVIKGEQSGRQYSAPQYPTATMVAAAAFDKKHGKLFFTPMFLNELRWADLSSNSDHPKFYTLQSAVLNLEKTPDEANNITRMTIAADGNGYMLNNDGSHLIKFTTGKKIVLTDLGSLVDASSNNHISVHNKCSSWGGDMVADIQGNLYLFTASKNVFKINIERKVATHLGSITGLSGIYTLNGAAVDNNDNVIVSSANSMEGFYSVNIKTLSATKLNTTGQIYNASDLANGNLLFTGQLRNTVGVAQLPQQEVIGNEFITIYPNPVIGANFKVTFDNKATGDYTILLTDVQGKTIMTKQVFVKSAGQVENVQMKSKPSNGMYMIKVLNSNKKSVFSDKIVIE